MKTRDLVTILATGLSAVGAATLVYGVLVESHQLIVDHFDIPLSGLPERFDGYKIAVIGDLHLRDQYSLDLAKQAVAMVLDAEPDIVVLVGDYVAHWRLNSVNMIGEALEPLLLMNGNVIAIPGNHDYEKGSPEILRMIFDELNIKLLRNESYSHQGITWLGIDSATEDKADIAKTIESIENRDQPRIVLWHEPDAVEVLPVGTGMLQISGHSHGGQFILPWGVVPMTSKMGKKYRDGFYPDAPTPIFVTRGVGTTGPPSRLNCPPQVAILSLAVK
jgi:uncharacterized protein